MASVEAILIALVLTTVFGAVSYSGFYNAVRSLNGNGEDDSDIFPLDFDFFAIVTIILDLVLWICKKIFPPRVYRIILRVLSFIIGVVFLILAILIWFII